MTTASSLFNTDHKSSEARRLSIEIEPSTPLILAMAQLFRTHEQPNQSLELCRLGLSYFPGHMGLRLGLAMAYWDLQEKEKAWAEIKLVTEELCQLSPVLEKFAEHARVNAMGGLSEWFTLLAQVLSQYPGDGQPAIKTSPPIAKNEIAPSFLKEEKEEVETNGEVLTESHVLSTLNDWLSQLKKNKEVV